MQSRSRSRAPIRQLRIVLSYWLAIVGACSFLLFGGDALVPSSLRDLGDTDCPLWSERLRGIVRHGAQPASVLCRH